jgi:hypothetical protein
MKLKLNNRWLRYPLYVIIFLFVSYILTAYLGVQHIKSKHKTKQLMLNLERLKKYTNSPPENYKYFKRKYTNTIDYSVISPFIIKSKHKTTVAGYDEYHLWYIFGIWTFKRRFRWIS